MPTVKTLMLLWPSCSKSRSMHGSWPTAETPQILKHQILNMRTTLGTVQVRMQCLIPEQLQIHWRPVGKCRAGVAFHPSAHVAHLKLQHARSRHTVSLHGHLPAESYEVASVHASS